MLLVEIKISHVRSGRCSRATAVVTGYIIVLRLDSLRLWATQVVDKGTKCLAKAVRLNSAFGQQIMEFLRKDEIAHPGERNTRSPFLPEIVLMLPATQSSIESLDSHRQEGVRSANVKS